MLHVRWFIRDCHVFCALQGSAVFGSLQCERWCGDAAIVVGLLIMGYMVMQANADQMCFCMQLEQAAPEDAFCKVQLRGRPKDCYQALLQILSHAAAAYSSDRWKDARQDAAVWQIQDQVCELICLYNAPGQWPHSVSHGIAV